MMWLLRFQKMPRLRLARTLMKSSMNPTQRHGGDAAQDHERLIREVHRAHVGDDVADERRRQDGDAAHRGRAFLVLVLGPELVAAEDGLAPPDPAEVADREARCRPDRHGGGHDRRR